MAQNARKLGLDFPHLVDSEFEYWRSLNNRYWPTVYLVDRCGRMRHAQIGEVHSGKQSGQRAEARLEALLREDGCAG